MCTPHKFTNLGKFPSVALKKWVTHFLYFLMFSSVTFHICTLKNHKHFEFVSIGCIFPHLELRDGF